VTRFKEVGDDLRVDWVKPARGFLGTTTSGSFVLKRPKPASRPTTAANWQ
jgi:hypothetical protein